MEARPSRMLAVLRECGALAQLLPEVDALFGAAAPDHRAADAGVRAARALDWSAEHGGPLPARYGLLARDLAGGQTARGVRLADRMSERLKVPLDCKDAARLAARWHRAVRDAARLSPAALLDLLHATDALRRPARLEALLAVCVADACSQPGAAEGFAPAVTLRNALAVVRSVDAGAVARTLAVPDGKKDDAGIAHAVRAARLKALRASQRAASAKS
jgi:tRNA nucleotidyltransferase (CCA-adding enzyme)